MVSGELPKVNPLWPNPRLLIALHSPDALLETGLRIAFRRKGRTVPHSKPSSPFSAVRFVWE
jgi:hypothetical protein